MCSLFKFSKRYWLMVTQTLFDLLPKLNLCLKWFESM